MNRMIKRGLIMLCILNCVLAKETAIKPMNELFHRKTYDGKTEFEIGDLETVYKIPINLDPHEKILNIREKVGARISAQCSLSGLKADSASVTSIELENDVKQVYFERRLNYLIVFSNSIQIFKLLDLKGESEFRHKALSDKDILFKEITDKFEGLNSNELKPEMHNFIFYQSVLVDVKKNDVIGVFAFNSTWKIIDMSSKTVLTNIKLNTVNNPQNKARVVYNKPKDKIMIFLYEKIKQKISVVEVDYKKDSANIIQMIDLSYLFDDIYAESEVYDKKRKLTIDFFVLCKEELNEIYLYVLSNVKGLFKYKSPDKAEIQFEYDRKGLQFIYGSDLIISNNKVIISEIKNNKEHLVRIYDVHDFNSFLYQ